MLVFCVLRRKGHVGYFSAWNSSLLQPEGSTLPCKDLGSSDPRAKSYHLSRKPRKKLRETCVAQKSTVKHFNESIGRKKQGKVSRSARWEFNNSLPL